MAMASESSERVEAAAEHKETWRRIIYDATGDNQKALRAIELAELNGMFDPIAALAAADRVSGAANKRAGYLSDKRCCSICDKQKKCHVCGDTTLMACSDCRINFAATVYVCTKAACRNEHELKCYGCRPSPDTEAEREQWIKIVRPFVEELALMQNGDALNGNVTICKQSFPARYIDAAIAAIRKGEKT